METGFSKCLREKTSPSLDKVHKAVHTQPLPPLSFNLAAQASLDVPPLDVPPRQKHSSDTPTGWFHPRALEPESLGSSPGSVTY